MSSIDSSPAPTASPLSSPAPSVPILGPTRDDSSEDPIYNCCGKPYGGKFMIFCEKCEEWLHGECVNVEQSHAVNIDKYYCKVCLEKDPSLEIVFTKKYTIKMEKRKKEEEEIQALRCRKCVTCIKASQEEAPCKTCTFCISDQPIMCLALRCVQAPPLKKKAGRPRKDQSQVQYQAQVLQSSPAPRPAPKPSTSDDEEFPAPEPKPIPTEDKPKRGRKKGWKKQQVVLEKVKHEEEEFNPESMNDIDREFARQVYRAHLARTRPRRNLVMEESKQCFGIDCVNETRPGSKYCSDDCGRSIARARLMKFLPQAVQEYWEHIPSAEIRYQSMAKEKQNQITYIQGELDKLKGMATMLERYANSLTKAQPSTTEDDGPENDGTALCTVCAHEVANKQLANHIHRCFVRHEKQSAFGYLGADNLDNLYCNEYNKVSNTYCKRLKVMCAEHYKGELENNMKVCGCPKIWDNIKDGTPSIQEIFVSAEQLMSKRFCLAPRKECTRHSRWLQTCLGIINNSRLNLLYKLNEVHEEFKAFKNAVDMHGDVITLMCTRPKQLPESNSLPAEVKDEPMET